MRDTRLHKMSVYLDELKFTEQMTDSEWIDAWVKGAKKDSDFVTRTQWIEYLNKMIRQESERLLGRVA